MALPPTDILRLLDERFAGKVTPITAPGSGQVMAVIDREHVRPILAFLRDDPRLKFQLLVDVTVVDHLQLELPHLAAGGEAGDSSGDGNRFAVVYVLYSLDHQHRFVVKARVPEDDPVAPSVSDLWKSALWGEREAHDMYGVEFEGNPDLRRLLMPQDYPGFPLRKDYPLRGRGERDAFPQYRPPDARTREAAAPGVSPPAGGAP
jgi:NADH-quinone oxidoreductase subunit C